MDIFFKLLKIRKEFLKQRINNFHSKLMTKVLTEFFKVQRYLSNKVKNCIFYSTDETLLLVDVLTFSIFGNNTYIHISPCPCGCSCRCEFLN